jgi:hypothetical protein
MTRTLKISEETFQKIKEQLTEGDYKEIQSLQDMIGE